MIIFWADQVATARWLNSAGVLLTSLGLMQISLMIHQNLGLAGLIQAALAVVLLGAVIVQLIAAVQGRTPRDGYERRGGDAWA